MAALEEWADWVRHTWQRFVRLLSGAPDFPPPANPSLLTETQGWFGEQLRRHANIPIARRGEYARAAGMIMARMTPTALLRLRQNTREVRFYATLEEMTVELARTEARVARLLAAGLPIGGAYQSTTRQLHLDGGEEETEARDILGLYAHEFSHALNGAGRLISSTLAWQQAWEMEIRRYPFSLLAIASPHEGFAEFGRVMYSGSRRRSFLGWRYPRCVEVWRGYGLW
ncbi:MAG TPA: hypothetical protein VKA46_29510 [Gemmataceae bacterium]|nr:hypothetical protein [Gemmataceae bacterium]